MSSLLLPRRFYSQPATSVSVDWSHPLTAGLAAAYIPSLGSINLATGLVATIKGSMPKASQDGVSWIMAATTDVVVDVVGGLEGPAKDISGFYVGPIGANGGSTASRIVHYGDGFYGNGFAVISETNNRAGFIIGDGGAQNVSSSTSNYYTGLEKTAYGFSFTNASNVSVYRDGVFFESIATTHNRSVPSVKNITIFNRDTQNRPIGVGYGMSVLFLWSRALSGEEHALISANPYQIFKVSE
jgi:hypothetical protein